MQEPREDMQQRAAWWATSNDCSSMTTHCGKLAACTSLPGLLPGF